MPDESRQHGIPVSRRNIIGMIGAACSAPFLSCAGSGPGFGDRYIDGLVGGLDHIRRNAADVIRDAANRCARSILSRNHCFGAMGHPLLGRYFDTAAAGLPPVFIPLRSPAMAGTIRDGDTVLYTAGEDIADRLKQQGISTIILGFAEDHGEPAGGLSIILTNCDVTTGEGSNGCVFPASGIMLATVVSMLAGEAYYRCGGIGRTGTEPPATGLSYLEAIRSRLASYRHKGAIDPAAALIARCVAGGGVLYVLDGTGLLGRELARPDAPAFARPATPQDLGSVRREDAVLIVAPRSNAQADLLAARTAAAATDTVITICPIDDEGGYRLFKNAASALDNRCPEREGLLAFDGGRRQFLRPGPTVNTALAWLTIAATADRLIADGHEVKLHPAG